MKTQFLGFQNEEFIKSRIKLVQTPGKMETYCTTLQQSFMYTNVYELLNPTNTSNQPFTLKLSLKR